MAKQAKMPKNKLGKVVIQANSVDVAPSASTIKQTKEDRQWKAQDALRDIQRAEDHRKDKGLMKDVKNLAKKQMNDLKGFC